MLRVAASPSIVAYYRVSTDKQGRSGLGLEAQRATVAAYAAGAGATVVCEFVEVESGKRSDRPQLASALESAKRLGATLAIAKLDRLARNARFLLSILESGANVVFCDLPHVPAGPVGKFLITQMAAVAELEAGLISERTKAALQAARERGVRLGNPTPAGSLERARSARAASAERKAGNVLPIIRQIEASGVSSLRGIAEALNARGVPSPSGGAWFAASVSRAIKRAA